MQNAKCTEILRLEKRISKLRNILTKLENGEHVQNRTLQNNLTADEYANMLHWREMQKEYDEMCEDEDKPDAIEEYEDRLRIALLAYAKYDRCEDRITVKKLGGISDTCFERLNEYLEEILYADPRLAEWFDRPISFEHGKEPGLTPGEVPRARTSRSLECKTNPYRGQYDRKRNINSSKTKAVSAALETLTNPPEPVDEEEQARKLKIMLKKL